VRQVTEWQENAYGLEFAIEQIEKYGDVGVIKKQDGKYAVFKQEKKKS